MTARIIPYFKRNSAQEFDRRSSAIVDELWTMMLTPAIVFASISQALWRRA